MESIIADPRAAPPDPVILSRRLVPSWTSHSDPPPRPLGLHERGRASVLGRSEPLQLGSQKGDELPSLGRRCPTEATASTARVGLIRRDGSARINPSRIRTGRGGAGLVASGGEGFPSPRASAAVGGYPLATGESMQIDSRSECVG